MVANGHTNIATPRANTARPIRSVITAVAWHVRYAGKCVGWGVFTVKVLMPVVSVFAYAYVHLCVCV